jgi:hypothetical protein
MWLKKIKILHSMRGDKSPVMFELRSAKTIWANINLWGIILNKNAAMESI